MKRWDEGKRNNGGNGNEKTGGREMKQWGEGKQQGGGGKGNETTGKMGDRHHHQDGRMTMPTMTMTRGEWGAQ